MKKVMIFSLVLLLASCKITRPVADKQVPSYYKIEGPSGEVFEVKAIFQDCVIDIATGRSTILLNENYKITPMYVYSKSN
jgi:hypothetical protein